MIRAETLSDEPSPAERPTGDRLDALYRSHAPDALRLAYLLTGDRALAEDLTQEAFVRVLGRFRDLRNPEAFWWYLRRTVVNLANTHRRRRKFERAYLEREGRMPAPPASDPDGRSLIQQALLGLRPEVRTAIVLRYYEDLTEAQTAEVMGCPVGTVKSMVSRAMDRLRAELAETEEAGWIWTRN
jgi:RNA polymerase sigma-70 factor (sigma-E family)